MASVDVSSPPPSSVKAAPLSSRQERNLVDYVDDQFLQITRNYKRKNHPPTTLPTLDSYLKATHTLLSIILQIPPAKKQRAALRTALLLRFSSEMLAAIPNYEPSTDVIDYLLHWLDELDKGWLAVLRNQVWDATLKEGLDAQVDGGADDMDTDTDAPVARRAVSQTDRARLRSILVSATSAFEEWLDTGGADIIGTDSAGDGLQREAGRVNIDQAFNDLFSRTLGEMGDLHGEILSTEQEVEME